MSFEMYHILKQKISQNMGVCTMSYNKKIDTKCFIMYFISIMMDKILLIHLNSLRLCECQIDVHKHFYHAEINHYFIVI